MANKQIKDFEVITDGTGTSILVQNNTTGTYNKISAENIAAAATTLSKAITAQENVTIQKQLILDENYTGDSSRIVKSTGVDYNNTTAGIIEFDFTEDTSKDEVWGLKIKNGSENYGIKADGKTFAHHVTVKFDDSVNCSNVWGIKIKKDTDAWGIKANGMIHGHHLMLDYGSNVSCPVPAVKYISPSGNNWGNTDVGVFEADLTADSNASNLYAFKLKNGSDAWGIKVNGDGEFKNVEATALEIEANFTTSPSPIKFTGDTILTYANSTAAASAGVPVGGIWVDNGGKMNVRLS